MKKNYMTPGLEVSELHAVAILAASGDTAISDPTPGSKGNIIGGGTGETGTQAEQGGYGNAKQMTTVFSMD